MRGIETTGSATSAHRVRTGSGSPSKISPSSADQNGDSAMRRSDRAGSSSSNTSVNPSDNRMLHRIRKCLCYPTAFEYRGGPSFINAIDRGVAFSGNWYEAGAAMSTTGIAWASGL